MGDSDDDGDFKRRDKFRSERRSGYDDRSPENSGGGGSRREWGSRESGRGGPGPNYGSGSGWGRDHPRGSSGSGGSFGYRNHRESRGYSPSRGRHEEGPPHKRMRPEWGDDRYEGRGGGGYYGGRNDYDRGSRGGFGSRGGMSGGGGPISHSSGGSISSSQQQPDENVQPAMMSFKSFLTTQDDSISDEEAIKKYAEYKLEFKRQQLNEFFVHHKDEEWFKFKYHPEDSVKRKEEQEAALAKRVEVFQEMWDKKLFQEATIDGDQTDKLVRILDSVVIKLEGGSDNDLKILEIEMEEAAAEMSKKANADSLKASETEKTSDDKKEKTDDETSKDKEGEEENKPEISSEQLELQKKAKEYLEAAKEGGGGENSEKKGKKRKRREFDGNEENDSGSESSDENHDEELPPGKDKKEETEEKKIEDKMETGDEENKKEEEQENKDQKNNGVHMEDGENKVEEKIDEENRPRALHKTASIFLRNLAPTITKQEVEAMCKRYSGFLRAAIADPQPERRWFRRGWVTFERAVKIKEICYNLNNIRLRECELGPIVNRDLTRRIRTVNGITVDEKVVRNDIKLAAKVITNLDSRWGLWQKKVDSLNGSSDDKDNNKEEVIGIGSNNPVLDNITDYLIEEISAEEEELLGKNADLEDGEEGEEGNNIKRDEELIKVLDRMLFYLRVVHSVDFYNHSEYPNEDEMPNRCGIMHARGIPPTGNVTSTEIDDYNTTFEKKMGSFLIPKTVLNEEETSKLGVKNEEDEVEKFVQVNTQELGKDKWLCPLSGKKFKGPDFVRKHIFNKHGEKVDEVKKEVQYFNNYLKDPKRPMLPENPLNKSSGSRRDASNSRGEQERGYSGFPREATNYPVYDERRDNRGYNEPRYAGPPDRGGYRGRGRDMGFGGRGGRVRDRVGPFPALRVTQYEADPRGVIDYSDVDLNIEADFF